MKSEIHFELRVLSFDRSLTRKLHWSQTYFLNIPCPNFKWKILVINSFNLFLTQDGAILNKMQLF